MKTAYNSSAKPFRPEQFEGEPPHPEPLLRREEPLSPAPPIAGKLQEKVPLMTAVREMPDVMRQKIAMSPRHDAFLFVRDAV